MTPVPDYRHLVDAVQNRRPRRLPVYEHIISPRIMERILGTSFVDLLDGSATDQREFFRHYGRFWRKMGYDTVSFEVCITSILPDSGAIMGGRPGPIQSRQDFERFPWDELYARYWDLAGPLFDALAATMPENMKAVGGVGNGVFEISEDLVGFEYLCYMQADDPGLLADLYDRIGELMLRIWRTFLQRHAAAFAVCRFGDDLGFKTASLLQPAALRCHVFPQYRRVIEAVHAEGKPFLWHSCGNIFAVMEDAIAAGIDAKHSNEDIIAPFDRWIQQYGERIGLLGGIDLGVLCQRRPDEITALVAEAGARFRRTARGFALGSGNSIPDYVPVDGYLAMIDGARRIRAEESTA
jgi:uroporphyrinogen decarboxylase